MEDLNIHLEKSIDKTDNMSEEKKEVDKTDNMSEKIEQTKKWTDNWNVSNNYPGQDNEVVYKQFDTSKYVKTNKSDNIEVDDERFLNQINNVNTKSWKPKKIDITTLEGQIQMSVKTAKGFLNKMTASTFDKLSEQYLTIAIEQKQGLLKLLIDQIFEQALTQPAFCSLYSNLCKKMYDNPTIKTGFTKELLTKCQEEFQKDTFSIIDEEQQVKAKRRMLGNIKFIGELYKNKILVVAIIHACVKRLLRLPADEEQVEALCKLLVNIGKIIDTDKSKTIIDSYFSQMNDIKKDVSARIRFMIEDIIILRTNGW